MSELRLGHGLDGIRASVTNGPGWRVSLWTQGCSLRCTVRCLNPHLLSPDGGRIVSVADVLTRVSDARDRTGELEGITILGGEPLDQPDAIADLLDRARRQGLTTMLYTGHVYEMLRSDARPIIAQVLSGVDLLVDGPFLPHLYDESLAWRGSSNQRLICLSGRYNFADLERQYRSQGKAFSIRSTPAGALSVSGLQERAGATKVAIAVWRSRRPQSPVGSIAQRGVEPRRELSTRVPP